MSVRPAEKSPRRKPRFERQLPQQRRQALIGATIECLKRYGHDGLSIRTISAQAGVSVGLINHHFPNKDELIAAAYRHFNSELVGGLIAAVERAPNSPRRACAPSSRPPSPRRILIRTCSPCGWCSGACTGIRA